MEGKLKITVLGSGTSTGVPVIGCDCETCLSTDQKDKRLRCSLYVQFDEYGVVIDTGPDFRSQVLKFGIRDIDAVLYTHLHNDHIIGFDDIRGFNFSHKKLVPAYAHRETASALRRVFPYAFGEAIQEGGGLPNIPLKIFDKESFEIGSLSILPLELWHGKLEVKGFRIGDFAYCTDTNFIPETTYDKLKGVKYLIIDGLRPEPHPTHFNIEESLEAIARIKPDRAYLTHIAHQIKHAEWAERLPKNVFLAYDGLQLELNYEASE